MKNNKLQNPKTQLEIQKRTIPQGIQNYQTIVATLPNLGKGLWLIGGFILFAILLLTGQFDATGLELIITSVFSRLAGK